MIFSTEQEWLKAIDIVEDRIHGRFVAPIHKLIPEEFSGFAIIALDCLLIESLNGFKEGRASKGNCEEYVVFLASSPHFKHEFSADVASEFCRSVRNGLIHDSETRHQWFIEKTKPSDRILGHDHLGNYVLNRNHFHVALEAELNDHRPYPAGLRGFVPGAVLRIPRVLVKANQFQCLTPPNSESSIPSPAETPAHYSSPESVPPLKRARQSTNHCSL